MCRRGISIATILMIAASLTSCGESPWARTHLAANHAGSASNPSGFTGSVTAASQRGPVRAGPDSSSSIHIVNMPSAVEAGRPLTLAVKTVPNAQLSIEMQDLGFSQFPNLQNKVADSQGKAAWTVFVDGGYRADLLPVIITAQLDGGRSDKLVTQIPVVKGSASKEEKFPLSVVSEVGAARAGGRVNMTVKTAPGAKVSIEAQGAGFPQLSSLFEQTAGPDGLVFWDWQIRENYEADKMPVIVTSDYDNSEEKIVGAINVLSGNVEPPVAQDQNPNPNPNPSARRDNGNNANNGNGTTVQADQAIRRELAGQSNPATH